MKVLVVGNGGREHVLCWKLNQSPRVSEVFCAPGNAGIEQHATCVDIDALDLEKLATFAQENNIAFTIAGPEAPLCAGIVDVFKEKGLRVFGPSKAGAVLEGSKSYAKQFMEKYNIPTAKAEIFNDEASAIAYVKKEFASETDGVVVKADGLAAGKGVIMAPTEEEAIAGIKECFNGSFGDAGYRVVIEELLIGEEASILALTDGKSIKPLASSQDHKRLLDNDEGPNTGGMGAYSPAPIVDDALQTKVDKEVLDNFLKGIQAENLDFHGIIYAGIMVTKKGIKVLEFNVRFGDPEVQAILMRLKTDFAEVIEAVIDEKLDELTLEWEKGSAVCVVIASGGYPKSYEKGFEITGLEEAEKDGAVVFHAGTSRVNGKIVNSGGRVLGVTAKGDDLASAIENSYNAVKKITWKDAIYRTDIAQKGLKHL